MENFESQQFRDNLAKNIKEAPKEERKDILDRAKETPEYQQARTEKIKERQEKGEKVKQLQEELNRMKESAIADGKMFYNENGEFEYALAPNGEKSRLGEKQWLEVRSSFFKSWYGDWENDKEGASKFIDDNGEPLVLYHGTTRKFDAFSHEAPKTFDLDNVKGAFFLTSDKKFAEAEYGKFKHNLIIDTLRQFNAVFFDGKATEWGVLIDKWNDFVRSVGTEKVNFKKEVSDGRGGHYSWTMVEFNGKPIFPTEEIEKIWDSKVPENFNEQDYEVDHWEGKKILLPKNSKQILMELFINSRNPNYKEALGGNIQEMDNLFAQGMIEKGVYATDQSTQHILSDPSFRSKPETDSVAIKFPDGQLAIAIFEASQAKSAHGNNGLFTAKSANIYE